MLKCFRRSEAVKPTFVAYVWMDYALRLSPGRKNGSMACECELEFYLDERSGSQYPAAAIVVSLETVSVANQCNSVSELRALRVPTAYLDSPSVEFRHRGRTKALAQGEKLSE